MKNKKKINVLSLFDGMSCGQIALNKVGFKINKYYASEINKSSIQVTQNNYPKTIQLGDVRNIDTKKLENIDILIGGSPCTNLSFGGKRKGLVTKENIEITTLEQYLKLKKEGFEFEGQSYLFWEYIYILKKVKPKYFLLENVMMSNKWKKVFNETIGYEAIMINSNLVSAQNRKRLYWTNIPNIQQPKDKNIKLIDILEKDKNNNFLIGNLSKEYINKKQGQNRWGNHFGTINTKKHNTLCAIGMCDTILFTDLKRFLTPLEAERLQTVPDYYSACVAKSNRYEMLGNGWTVDVIKHIFTHIPI